MDKHLLLNEIEILASELNDKIGKLEDDLINSDELAQKQPPYKRKQIIDRALEEMDLFQKTTLFDLRKAFE